MRVLLDESVPRALGFELTGHYVRTAQVAGFAGLSNGNLMKAMQAEGFEVLITFDQNLTYQQNQNLPVKVLVLVANDNRVTTAKGFVGQILQSLQENTLARVERLVNTI